MKDHYATIIYKRHISISEFLIILSAPVECLCEVFERILSLSHFSY